MKRVILLAVLLALALYAAPAGAIDETLLEGLPVTEDYITYEVIGNTVTIRYYASPKVHAVIPSQINGLTVTAIGDFAFSNCEITSVTIPETVTTIGAGAFEHCYGLSEITIPSSVTSIGSLAFLGCSVQQILVMPGNQFYTSSEGILYDLNMRTLIAYPKDKAGSTFTVPLGVRTIADGAFAYNQFLENIVVQESVNHIGWLSFLLCENLSRVNILNGSAVLMDDSFVVLTNLTVMGYEGSTAQDYAQETGIPFQALPAGIQVEAILVFPPNVIMSPGETRTVHVQILPENAANREFLLTSSDESVVAAGSNGAFTAGVLGTATLTVSARDNCGVYAVCPVTVTAFSVPESFSVRSLDSQSIRASWNAAPDADGYVVYRSNSQDGVFNQIADVADPAYVDSGLLPYPNGEYWYKVRAYMLYDGMERYYSDFTQVKHAYTVGKPGMPFVNIAGDQRLIISWNSVMGALTYSVSRNTSLQDTPMIVITTESNQFVDGNRTAGVQYYYRIKANGPNGPGSFSEPGERAAMGVPVITQAVPEGNNAIRISWSAVPGSTGYLLYRGTSKTNGFEPVTDTTGTTCLDTGLTRYSTYYYVVRAYQGNGYSGYSNCAEVVLQGQ